MSTAPTQSLHRGLTALSNGVITFAGVGVFAGLFSLYGFSWGIAGPAEFWGWPLVAISVTMMVLVFAELASAFPFAGSMYQWPTALAGRRIGWGVGWLYLGAVIVLMTAYYASLPTIVRPLFGWKDSFATNRDIILFAALFAVMWNLGSVAALGKLAKYGMVIELGIVTTILAVVFIIGPHNFGALTDSATVVTSGKTSSVHHVSSFGSWLPLLLGGGIFNAFWVLYTFENAGTLGEETKDARRNAPRAVLGATAFAIGCGFLFLICLTTSVPHIADAMIAGSPAENAITNHLPSWVLKLFLGVLTEGLLLATATMFSGAARHIFAMARDGQVPCSRPLSRTLPDGSPWVATIVLGVLSLIPVFIFTTNTASIVGGATAAMYLVYFAVMIITLVARLRGWPQQRGHFSLGRWGTLVNALAVLGTGASFVDLMWSRAATNPTYDQIIGSTTHNVLRHIPMAWYIVGVPALVGIVYYAVRHRRIHTAELALERMLDGGGGGARAVGLTAEPALIAAEPLVAKAGVS
jgi:amino acid transporter